MNPPRSTAEDYIQFLLATPKVYTAAEAGRVTPPRPDAPAHDSYTRLLHRLEPEPDALWEEVRPLLRTTGGVLVIDDSVLDKPFARHMGLVGYHWSGRHKRVVQGIDLVTLLWTDGDALWPCDYRLVNPAERLTKNDHFRDLVRVAKERGFAPRYVVFDSWYSGKENLKAVRDCGWLFLTQVRSNRKVNPDRTGNRPIRECDIAAAGTVVHLEGFGLVKAFRIATTNGGTEHWITNDLAMDEGTRLALGSGRGGSRSTTGASSSTAARTSPRCGTPARCATTSGARSGRSCVWSGTGSPRGSVGSPPRHGSSATPSVPTWGSRTSRSQELQPRNS